MFKIQIQLPLNISRGLEEMLWEYIEAGQWGNQAETIIENSHACGSKYDAAPNQADIMIGFMPDLTRQTDEYILDHLTSAVGRFSIRKELHDSGFVDLLGCFHTFGIVPFIMFYNPDYTGASEIPCTWNELLEPKWKGRIMMPGKEHMAPKVIRAVLKHQNPALARAVDDNIICSGMPPNVIEAVKSGEFALGITNITFGKISESQRIKMIWPEDGLLCMPQIMAWKKGSKENALKLGEFILSPKVQNFLTQQAFVSVAPESELPEIIKNNNAKLKWTGWEDFREALRKSEL